MISGHKESVSWRKAQEFQDQWTSLDYVLNVQRVKEVCRCRDFFPTPNIPTICAVLWNVPKSIYGGQSECGQCDSDLRPSLAGNEIGFIQFADLSLFNFDLVVWHTEMPQGRGLLESGTPTIILSEVCCRYSDEFVSELAPEGQFHGLLDCGFYIP